MSGHRLEDVERQMPGRPGAKDIEGGVRRPAPRGRSGWCRPLSDLEQIGGLQQGAVPHSDYTMRSVKAEQSWVELHSLARARVLPILQCNAAACMGNCFRAVVYGKSGLSPIGDTAPRLPMRCNTTHSRFSIAPPKTWGVESAHAPLAQGLAGGAPRALVIARREADPDMARSAADVIVWGEAPGQPTIRFRDWSWREILS